jgi:hypothetical protein
MGTVASTLGTGTVAACVSLALDQLVFAPTFLAIFISALFAIEGNAAEAGPPATPSMYA